MPGGHLMMSVATSGWEGGRLKPACGGPAPYQAGLFYWSDYDRKSQGRPCRFSLKQGME